MGRYKKGVFMVSSCLLVSIPHLCLPMFHCSVSGCCTKVVTRCRSRCNGCSPLRFDDPSFMVPMFAAFCKALHRCTHFTVHLNGISSRQSRERLSSAKEIKLVSILWECVRRFATCMPLQPCRRYTSLENRNGEKKMQRHVMWSPWRECIASEKSSSVISLPSFSSSILFPLPRGYKRVEDL